MATTKKQKKILKQCLEETSAGKFARVINNDSTSTDSYFALLWVHYDETVDHGEGSCFLFMWNSVTYIGFTVPDSAEIGMYTYFDNLSDCKILNEETPNTVVLTFSDEQEQKTYVNLMFSDVAEQHRFTKRMCQSSQIERRNFQTEPVALERLTSTTGVEGNAKKKNILPPPSECLFDQHESEIQIKSGFPNADGKSCYIISVVGALLSHASFRYALKHVCKNWGHLMEADWATRALEYLMDLTVSGADRSEASFNFMQNLFTLNSFLADGFCCLHYFLYRAFCSRDPRRSEIDNQDAQEFCTELMEIIHSETVILQLFFKRVDIEPQIDLCYDVFGFAIEQKTYCEDCEGSYVQISFHSDLNLTIPLFSEDETVVPSLMDALRVYFGKQIVSGTCRNGNCENYIEGSIYKHSRMLNAPPILAIGTNRCVESSGGARIVKSQSPVHVPDTIDLSEFMVYQKSEDTYATSGNSIMCKEDHYCSMGVESGRHFVYKVVAKDWQDRVTKLLQINIERKLPDGVDIILCDSKHPIHSQDVGGKRESLLKSICYTLTGSLEQYSQFWARLFDQFQRLATETAHALRMRINDFMSYLEQLQLGIINVDIHMRMIASVLDTSFALYSDHDGHGTKWFIYNEPMDKCFVLLQHANQTFYPILVHQEEKVAERQLLELRGPKSYVADLTGAVIHSGEDIEHGHYYANVRGEGLILGEDDSDELQAQWFELNDNKKPKKVSKQSFQVQKETNGHLLFYTQR